MCCWYTTQLSIAIQYTGNSYLHQHILYLCLQASSCLLLDSPNVHPHLKKKNQRKMANFNLTVNVLHYSLNTDNPRWILTLQERQLAKKAPDAWRPRALATRKEKLLNLNYFLFLLWWLGLWFLSCRSPVNSWYHSCLLLSNILPFQFSSIKNLASHFIEATTSAIGLEYSNNPTIPCNK